jgi:hypothetical protein
VIIVKVSGKTYYGALDPGCTDVPKEEGWPNPTFQRVGRSGLRACYHLTTDQAKEMASHLETMAQGFAFGSDDDTRAEGRAFARDALRIRAQLEETT